MSNQKTELPNLNKYSYDIFVKKTYSSSSPLSSDLPSRLNTDSVTYNDDVPKVLSNTLRSARKNISSLPIKNEELIFMSNKDVPQATSGMLSDTSPAPIDQNMLYSPTSDDEIIPNPRLLSDTSDMNNINKNVMYSPTSDDSQLNNVSANFDWKNTPLYFSQIDMDVSWMDKKDQSNSLIFGNVAEFFGFGSEKKPVPVVFDFKKAIHVSKKICKFAELVNNPNKQKSNIVQSISSRGFPNAVMSSVEPGKFSYPIFGSVIFCLKFKEQPVIVDVGTITKENYGSLNNQNADIVLYNAGWCKQQFEMKRALLFNLSKVDVTELHLCKCECALGNIRGHAMLKILNSSSDESRFNKKYIDILCELYKNGNLKVEKVQSGGNNKTDRNLINEYKKKYINNKL